ncbi:MAG: helix-turn-helix domain-containing protein [Bifidobacteriaceae bacterium]|nr:helix-turn-helix domain-containing protein [Bifidobacteriaceae bacterium]
MSVDTAGQELRRRRVAAGWTQRQLAQASAVPQPSIAAYETGARRPAQATAQRLDRALRTPTPTRLKASREALIGLAAARHLHDVRVFGSVARGAAGPGSDVDLLVHPSGRASIFDLAAFQAAAEELLGLPVDVVSDRGSGPAMDRIRAEAVEL